MVDRSDRPANSNAVTGKGEMMTFEQASQVIVKDAAKFRGVVLDKMIETGPRGGKVTYWRAAWARNFQVAPWCCTRDEAARIAPGYEG